MATNNEITRVDELQRRRRRKWLIIVGVLALIAVLTLVESVVYELRAPSNITDNIRLFALLNINIVIIMALVLLVVRQLVKLYLDRRHNVLGSKFKAKLVVAFVALSLIPTVLLFLVSSNLISSTVDSWFNTQNEESLRKSLVVAQIYYENTLGAAFKGANEIAAQTTQYSLLDRGNIGILDRLIRKEQQETNLGIVRIVGVNGEELINIPNSHIPQSSFNSPLTELVKTGLKGREFSIVRRTKEGDLIDGVVPIFSKWNPDDVVGLVIFNYFDSRGLMQEINDIRAAYEEYTQRKIYKSPLKSVYIMIVLVATLIIIFSAVWIGFQLARGITIPFQMLVEGTRAVAAGDLTYRVEVQADDEVKILVDSFNQMTSDLFLANAEIHKTNLNLEQHTHYIETILENIATGVISIDDQGVIATINKSAAKMLKLNPHDIQGIDYRKAFNNKHLEGIYSLIADIQHRQCDRLQREIRLQDSGSSSLTLISSATVLRDREQRPLGMVVVLDDLTQLIKAQKTAAWREVAQQIAHEIKNPLTPIQLCTQRLQKKYSQGGTGFPQILDECTSTIIREVEGLKTLVNEFSSYARMPAPKPESQSLGKIIENTVTLYAGALEHAKINLSLDPKLPPVMLDAEQIKRVFINLIDNALQASDGYQEITVSTKYIAEHQMAHVEVADLGIGIQPEDKERLFLPHFSRRKGGSGLGLAIVYRIIGEHQGTIRVEDNQPRGTKFVIDLPVGG